MDVHVADCPLGAKCEEVKEEGGKQVILRCPWYIQLRGQDPNTGVERDEFACAIAWLPILLIENAKEVRQGAAATESFRNAVISKVQTAKAALAGVTRVPAITVEVEDAEEE